MVPFTGRIILFFASLEDEVSLSSVADVAGFMSKLCGSSYKTLDALAARSVLESIVENYMEKLTKQDTFSLLLLF